jgi:predicted lipid-binding transport protein (Tim44 family)
LLNNAFPVLVKPPYFPLFLDTVFTVTLTLTGGLFWGALTGALTNVIYNTFFFWGWEGYLFALCNIATALVTWLFMRFFPRELGQTPDASQPTPSPLKSRRFEMVADKVIVLILLSFGLCIAMSVLGGLISALIQIFNPSYAKEPFVSAAMSDQNLPLILTEIMSRFPQNIIDRLITAFAGYGFALALHRISTIKS